MQVTVKTLRHYEQKGLLLPHEGEEMGTDSALIQFKKLDAVPTAICMKHYGPYDRFYESYVELFKYIEEQGYEIVGHPRYNYIDGIWNQEDPEKWLTLIQVPAEKIEI